MVRSRRSRHELRRRFLVLNVPDTPENTTEFTKVGNRSMESAFPQIQMDELDRYRPPLEAGTDPALVAVWTVD